MKVLMVCLGNICRSPMAQGVLEQKLFERGLSWKVDSAGTNGYHDGESPDPRAIKCAATHGIDISNQISRKITPDDFLDADLICVMDDMNYHTVTKLAPHIPVIKFIYLWILLRIHLFLLYLTHIMTTVLKDHMNSSTWLVKHYLQNTMVPLKNLKFNVYLLINQCFKYKSYKYAYCGMNFMDRV
ncbi:MAG: low molecular weight phosphotyrosine protein phosphatase [Saprospiraceae bacterium]|nr:low molecular weight phosphotyrosine protein phosphatase [Saprospiraceae bacterium]